MSLVFSIIFPVFGLIFAGYACRRIGLLGPAAAAELNRFVVWLALPAMLFQIMVKAQWSALYQPAFTAAFACAGLGLFALVACVQCWRGKPLTDASVDALSAAYPNTGYMGFPLTLMLFGADSMVPTTIATMLVVCVMFGLAIALMESAQAAQHPGTKLHLRLLHILWSLLKNPLIASPLLGIAVGTLDGPLPASIDTFLSMLAAAASPCALVSLGLFLASYHVKHTAQAPSHAPPPEATQETSTAWMLTALKLLALPAITWAVSTWVFQLSATQVHIAVLLSALPTGTGPYMLADMYQRAGAITARTVLYSTLLSIATLSALIQWILQAPTAAA
ncbi:AEC family transporter [Lampropedia puyangensis]|uniref:AEC family transporter n=1 Tax=Lampropedia puyangensis TaxID=1330072 RepID=UPI0026C65517